MANYSVLKAAVQAVIKTNGNQEITGANMQSTLISIINSLGTGYQFMGVATPSTSPGTPDYNVAYIGGAGTYANFGTSVTVPVGSIGVFKYNGSWTKETLSLGLAEKVEGINSIFSQVPVNHNPLLQFIDLSIQNRATDKVYWLQMLWRSNTYQQLTIFRADASNPAGYDSFKQFKDISVVDTGIKTYTVTFATGEIVTIVIDWDLTSAVNISYSYKLPDYVYNPYVFSGGLTYNKLQKTDKTLQVADVPADSKAVGDILLSIIKENIPFNDMKGIWARTESGHIGGEEFTSAIFKNTNYIAVEDIFCVYCVLQAQTSAAWAGIACYDSTKNYLGCIQGFYYNQPTRQFYPSDFIENTAFVRFCTYYESAFENSLFVNIVSKKSIYETIEDYIKPEIGAQDIYWAACGDSITNANHGNIYDILESDPYMPIDGYAALNTYKRKNYAYYIAKKNRIQWANYGYGGTTMTHTAPKAYEGQVFLPFVDNRITQLKSGIDWDYISIQFGWNDCAFNPIYQRDLWLTSTYGTTLGYPVQTSQIGATGFATQAQKDACDAAVGSVGGVEYTENEKYFFAKFIGTINDATKNTWYGAFNYAIPYLLNKYRKAKLLIVAPYISPSWQSAMIREATIAIANKWGVVYFDFENLPYWYKKTVINTLSFPNPDNANGYWYSESGTAFEATINGYNTAKYSYDGLHPSNTGYITISGPIGDKLING